MKGNVTTEQNEDLRADLEERRHEVMRDIQGRIREGRDAAHGVGDMGDLSEADMRADLDRALLQMRAEALTRIDSAIRRLDDGEYGRCVECEGDITARRLRALPFAIRCRACEERREHVPGRVVSGHRSLEF